MRSFPHSFSPMRSLQYVSYSSSMFRVGLLRSCHVSVESLCKSLWKRFRSETLSLFFSPRYDEWLQMMGISLLSVSIRIIIPRENERKKDFRSGFFGSNWLIMGTNSREIVRVGYFIWFLFWEKGKVLLFRTVQNVLLLWAFFLLDLVSKIFVIWESLRFEELYCYIYF